MLPDGLLPRDANYRTDILLYINGKRHLIRSPPPSGLLVDFLRDTLHLTGTKIGCGEGGCGACTVVLGTYDARSHQVSWAPINSCLRLLATLDGAAIVTVEGIGSTRDGMNPVQERLAEGNGTQCGFCTPGWVASMYGLLLQKGTQLSAQEIEGHFDGNLCRCTGYRPILESFKSFAIDSEASDPSDHGQRRLEAGSHSCKGKGKGACGGKGKGGCHRDRAGSAGESSGEETDDGWVKVDTHGEAHGLPDVEDLLSHCVPTTRCLSLPPHLRGPYPGPLEVPFPQELRDYTPSPLRFQSADGTQVWLRVLAVDELLNVLREFRDRRVQLVVGNTSMGVSKYYNATAPHNTPDEYDVRVDISRLSTLTDYSYDEHSGKLTVGAAVTLSQLLHLLQAHDSGPPPSFPNGLSLFGLLHEHLTHVAHEQVRNAGCWAGNLMLFHRHRAFPSDVNLVFAAAMASLTIVDLSGAVRDISMTEFWDLPDVTTSPFVILSATFTARPPLPPGTQAPKAEVVCRSFRVAQRAVNSHAHVNAAFVAHVQPPQEPGGAPVCLDATIVYSGVSKTAFRARRCEGVLSRAALSEDTLAQALEALRLDLEAAGHSSAYGSQDFRMQLTRSFLYMYFLTCQGPSLSLSLASGATVIERPVSTATQSFSPDPSLAPVSQPVMKLAGPMQTTGEAVYTDDEPAPPTTLFGALVYSTRGLSKLLSLDTAPALQVEGVVDVVVAESVPGANDLTMGYNDEHFLVPVGGTVQCVGAALAVVVATSAQVARQAARKVQATYEPLRDEQGQAVQPLITLPEAIAAESFLPGIAGIKELKKGDTQQALATAPRTASGRILAGGQKHFYFEPQTCLAVPSEGGSLSLHLSTQAPSDTHTVVSKILDLPKHKVSVTTRRTGGGFGGKLTRCFQNAAAAALCAHRLRAPVRVANERSADFVLVGGREGMCFDYDVGFDEQGKVLALELRMYMDGGAATDNTLGDMDMAMLWADNVYYFPNYHAKAYCCKTHTAVTTSMRAPGVVQSVMATELIIQRIARAVNRPVQSVQEANFYKSGQVTPYGQTLGTLTLDTVWGALKQRTDVAQKQAEIDEFNRSNRWRKRGLSLTAVKYGIQHAGLKAAASVKVYQEDGSVAINHYGCEVGQGIHTKVAQAAAYALGVPLDKIIVTPTTTDKVPNATATGGSSTSETAVQAMLDACAQLTQRLAPFRASLGDKATWQDVVAAAAAKGTCLSVEGWYAPLASGSDMFKYFVHCAAATTIELHLLTGQLQILSTELVYDCGQSLNPLADIGQIEGAFIQGVGFYTTEEVVYDNQGMLLSAGTWDYKPPSAFDIPIDFKVSLLPNLPNPDGVLRSKATGEPPYMIANSVYFAIKEAIRAARAEAGDTADFELPIPASVDARLLACNLDPSLFKLSA